MRAVFTRSPIPHVSKYLVLETAADRKYAESHIQWLRERAVEILPESSQGAKDLEEAADELEADLTALRRGENKPEPLKAKKGSGI
jgi:hypothetical protein